MSADHEPAKRILIDEDWKSQVERERDQQRRGTDGGKSASGDPTSRATPETTSETNATESEAPPPASFAMIISMFATQALMNLGQFPDPQGQPPRVDLAWAQHYIDTLAVLEEKTRGQLTAEEHALLDRALHELRLTFVYVRNREQASASRG